MNYTLRVITRAIRIATRSSAAPPHSGEVARERCVCGTVLPATLLPREGSGSTLEMRSPRASHETPGSALRTPRASRLEALIGASNRPPTREASPASTVRSSREAENGSDPRHVADSRRSTQQASVHARIMLFMLLWFGFSGCTLFGNKHILSTLKADPNVLAVSQMTMTATFGAVKMYGPCLTGLGPAQPTPLSTQSPSQFLACMSLVGLMRVVTVMLGLVSLKYVAVSFTETIKSSAPFFTVVFARLMLGEVTSARVRPARRPHPSPAHAPAPAPALTPASAHTPASDHAPAPTLTPGPPLRPSRLPRSTCLWCPWSWALPSARIARSPSTWYATWLSPLPFNILCACQHAVCMWHVTCGMWASWLPCLLRLYLLGGLPCGGLQQRHRLCPECLLEEVTLHTLQLRQPTGEG